jgi:hypothetical protein
MKPAMFVAEMRGKHDYRSKLAHTIQHTVLNSSMEQDRMGMGGLRLN